jgi:hypothetical protein
MCAAHEDAVTLIFPPLIESNFGSFFPATAVLAAFLEQNGVRCVQEDLNEAFAMYLLSEEVLPRIAAGKVPGAPLGSMTAAAARWSMKNRDSLVDEQGRHWFGNSYEGTDEGNSYVMEMLARPFQLDPGAEVLTVVNAGTHPVDAFERFYASSGIFERIPPKSPLIGISVPMGPQLGLSILLARMLKKRRPQTPVVLGGPTFSLMSLQDLEVLLNHHPAVDCVVRFDGEYPLLALAERARERAFSAEGVAGASYRRGNNICHEPPAPGPSVNTLPIPIYPREALGQIGDPTLGITQARGCYWGKCDYCDFVELFHDSQPFRGRHPDNFVGEIAALMDQTGIGKFRFITESIPPAFARRMSQLIIDRNIRISWNSFAMVDRRFDEDLLRLMVSSGCEFLTVGMETTNTRVLKLVHKSADRDENLRFLEAAKRVGMKLVINLIPDLPSTTYREAMATLEEVKKLADSIARVNVFPFEPTRSSNIGRHPEHFGLIRSNAAVNMGQAQYELNHLGSIDPAMTPVERAEVYNSYQTFSNHVSRRRLPRSLLVDVLFAK